MSGSVRADLHSHSTASDGTCPPAEVMRRARAAGLDVIALTDHDTVAGHDEARGGAAGGADAGAGHGAVLPSGRPQRAPARLPVRPGRPRTGRGMRPDQGEPGAPGQGDGRAAGRARRAGHLGAGQRDSRRRRGRPAAHRAGDGRGRGDRRRRTRRSARTGSAPAAGPTSPGTRSTRRARSRWSGPAGGVSRARAPAGRAAGMMPDEVIAGLAAAGLTGVEVWHPDQDQAAAGSAAGSGRAASAWSPAGGSDDHGELTGYRIGSDTIAPDAYERLVSQATGAAPAAGDDRSPAGLREEGRSPWRRGSSGPERPSTAGSSATTRRSSSSTRAPTPPRCSTGGRPRGARGHLHARARRRTRRAAVEVAAGTRRRWRCTPRTGVYWREVHPKDDPEIDMEDGGIFEVADVALEVIHAPGHSPGSVCIYSEDLQAVFAGDVLSADGPVPHENGVPRLRPPAQLDRRARADAAGRRPGCCPDTAMSSRSPRRRSASTPG